MLASDVKLPERVLRHLRSLQDHLVQQRVVAARDRVDGVLIHRVDRRTGLGLDSGARLVQALHFFDDLYLLDRGLRRGNRRGPGPGVRRIGRRGRIGRAGRERQQPNGHRHGSGHGT